MAPGTAEGVGVGDGLTVTEERVLSELLVAVELLTRWLAASLFVIVYPTTRQQLWAMSCRQGSQGIYRIDARKVQLRLQVRCRLRFSPAAGSWKDGTERDNAGL